jgi:hypothetical protein
MRTEAMGIKAMEIKAMEIKTMEIKAMRIKTMYQVCQGRHAGLAGLGTAWAEHLRF